MGNIFCWCIKEDFITENVIRNIEFTEEEIKLILSIAKCKSELLHEGKKIKQNITVERENLIIPFEISQKDNVGLIETLISVNRVYDLLNRKKDKKRNRKAIKELEKIISINILRKHVIYKL